VQLLQEWLSFFFEFYHLSDKISRKFMAGASRETRVLHADASDIVPKCNHPSLGKGTHGVPAGIAVCEEKYVSGLTVAATSGIISACPSYRREVDT